MQAYRDRRGSDFYAPYGTCRKCGWEGKDWGFKYHGYCKKCHTQWKKEKAEEHRRLKPPNENMELSDGVVVTRNVRERLRKKAISDVPQTRRSHSAGMWGGISLFISVMAMFALLLTLCLQLGYARYLWVFMMLGLVVYRVCKRIETNERQKQMPKVNARLEELARDRQRRIDETNAFYASSEWRLVREQVIDEQGRVCQECRSRITTDYDLTVDHIKPRSKFPELALEKANLQVLCRKCNSAKGATSDEADITNQVTASF